MKARFLFCLFLGAIVSVYADTAVDNLVLPERALPALEPILQAAAEQSPRLLARSLDLEIAENGRIAGRAGLLPYFGGSFRLYEARDDRADLSSPTRVQKLYYDVSVTQPLFHWGERMNNARVAELQKAIAQGNYREAYRGLMQDLRQRYLGLIALKQQVVRASAVAAYSQQQVKLGEERLAKKVISEAEMYPLRVNAETNQIALERVEFELATAKRTFARLTGQAELRDDQIPETIPTLSYDASSIERLLAAFLAQREPPAPEAVVARHQLQIAELNYKNEKTRLRPKFNLVVGANQDQQTYTLNTAQKYRVNSLYGGISLGWTLFDGFYSRSLRRNALARLRQTEIELGDVYHRVGQQAQSQAKQLNFAARTMAIHDRALVSAEGNLRTKTGEFQRGAVAESDVTLARLAMLDSRIYALNARIDFLFRVTDLLGTLTEDPILTRLPVK